MRNATLLAETVPREGRGSRSGGSRGSGTDPAPKVEIRSALLGGHSRGCGTCIQIVVVYGLGGVFVYRNGEDKKYEGSVAEAD